MNIKKILRITGISVAVIIVILVGLLVRSCQLHTDSLYGLKVIGDGAGGAIAVYEDSPSEKIYVQKISAEGKTLWGEKGVLLSDYNTKSYSYRSIYIVSDGSGGAIIAWPESFEKTFRPSSYLARIDAGGKVLWQRGFIYFEHLISDGSGGAIIAFDHPVGLDIIGDENEPLTLTKIDSEGNYPWELQGVTIPRPGYRDGTLQMTGDGSGGAIVVWGEKVTQLGSSQGSRIFSQRIASDGKLLWGDNVLLYTTPEGTWVDSLQAAGDGVGGAIVSWFQVTEVPTGSPGHQQVWDIAVQKVDTSGKVVWQPNGVPLDISKADSGAAPTSPALVSDNAGGAIVIWRDSRIDAQSQASVYAQQIDASGNLKWQAGGVKVSSTSLNPRSQIISDGLDGAIIAYSFEKDGKTLHVQKLNGSGQTTWQENGVSITESGFYSQFIASDVQGGVIVAWGVGKGMFSSEKAFIQKVSAEGKTLWGEGIRLNP